MRPHWRQWWRCRCGRGWGGDGERPCGSARAAVPVVWFRFKGAAWGTAARSSHAASAPLPGKLHSHTASGRVELESCRRLHMHLLCALSPAAASGRTWQAPRAGGSHACAGAPPPLTAPAAAPPGSSQHGEGVGRGGWGGGAGSPARGGGAPSMPRFACHAGPARRPCRTPLLHTPGPACQRRDTTTESPCPWPFLTRRL